MFPCVLAFWAILSTPLIPPPQTSLSLPASLCNLTTRPNCEFASPLHLRHSTGSVLAVELKSKQGGYASDDAREVTGRLRQAGVYCRPLGNVVYLMVTPMTQRAQCNELLGALEAALG